MPRLRQGMDSSSTADNFLGLTMPTDNEPIQRHDIIVQHGVATLMPVNDGRCVLHSDHLRAVQEERERAWLERDKVWCAAIIATQVSDMTRPFLYLDVQKLLRRFNESRPDRDEALQLISSELDALKRTTGRKEER